MFRCLVSSLHSIIFDTAFIKTTILPNIDTKRLISRWYWQWANNCKWHPLIDIRTHSRRPMSRPYGRAMGRLLWVKWRKNTALYRDLVVQRTPTWAACTLSWGWGRQRSSVPQQRVPSLYFQMPSADRWTHSVCPALTSSASWSTPGSGYSCRWKYSHYFFYIYNNHDIKTFSFLGAGNSVVNGWLSAWLLQYQCASNGFTVLL